MAFFSDSPTSGNGPTFFAAVTNAALGFFVRLAETQDRSATVWALQQRSDRELADIGITREDIVRHVYKDIHYL